MIRHHKKSFTAIALLLLVMATGYVGCGDMVFPETWRYRITVNVETPEGLKSGSTVREVVNRDNTPFGIKLPDAAARFSSVKGEAVVIDLGKRGVAFALIDNGSYGELYSAFAVKDPFNTTGDFNKLRIGSSAPLSRKDWPMFVAFRDISDPRSIVLIDRGGYDQKVEEAGPHDNIENVFGEGVSIKGITVDIVDDPVTQGKVDEYLTETFWETFRVWWSEINAIEKMKFVRLFGFKQGE